jgi:maleylpyruvate isomerase
VGVPTAETEQVRLATHRLLRSTEALTDQDVGQPSVLPGWNRAEVLTHLARNADGLRRVVEHGARGEVADMYPGGREQRAADIAAGRAVSARVLLADLRHACDALMNAWQALPADRWNARGRTASGTRTMHDTLGIRLREVELHHVDLAAGYSPVDWPVRFVRETLDEAIRTLPSRGAPHRPFVQVRYRVEATDHGRTWLVAIDGHDVAVAEDDGGDIDAAVSGWGCDLLAWLYGRTGVGGSITTAGRDGQVLRLSAWFPYP